MNWDGLYENGENSDAIDRGWTHAVIIGGIPSLQRFQVDPYGKSRLKAQES